MDTAEITASAAKQGILLDCESPRRIRLVTHYWVDDTAVDKAIQAFSDALG